MKWEVNHGSQVINVNMGHIENAIDTACSVLTKELIHNDRIKGNPAQAKMYDIHISVLRLVEKIFQEGYAKFEEHQRKQIPRKHDKQTR